MKGAFYAIQFFGNAAVLVKKAAAPAATGMTSAFLFHKALFSCMFTISYAERGHFVPALRRQGRFVQARYRFLSCFDWTHRRRELFGLQDLLFRSRSGRACPQRWIWRICDRICGTETDVSISYHAIERKKKIARYREAISLQIGFPIEENFSSYSVIIFSAFMAPS